MSKNSFVEQHYGIGRVEIVEVGEDDSDEYDEDDLGIAMRRDEHINMESIQRIINGVVPQRHEEEEEEEDEVDEENNEENENYAMNYENDKQLSRDLEEIASQSLSQEEEFVRRKRKINNQEKNIQDLDVSTDPLIVDCSRINSVSADLAAPLMINKEVSVNEYRESSAEGEVSSYESEESDSNTSSEQSSLFMEVEEDDDDADHESCNESVDEELGKTDTADELSEKYQTTKESSATRKSKRNILSDTPDTAAKTEEFVQSCRLRPFAYNRKRRSPYFDPFNPIYRKPLEEGWVRELVYRNINLEKRTRFADVYYYTPCGKKLRSTIEVKQHLTSGLTINNFTFAKESLGVNDGVSEIVRVARVSLRNSLEKINNRALRLRFEQRKGRRNKKKQTKKLLGQKYLKNKFSKRQSPLVNKAVQEISEDCEQSNIQSKEIVNDKENKNEIDTDTDSLPEIVENSKDDEDSGDGGPNDNLRKRLICSTRCRCAFNLFPTIECDSCKQKFHPQCADIPFDDRSDEEDITELEEFICPNCVLEKRKTESRFTFDVPPPKLTPIINNSHPSMPQVGVISRTQDMMGNDVLLCCIMKPSIDNPDSNSTTWNENRFLITMNSTGIVSVEKVPSEDEDELVIQVPEVQKENTENKLDTNSANQENETMSSSEEENPLLSEDVLNDREIEECFDGVGTAGFNSKKSVIDLANLSSTPGVFINNFTQDNENVIEINVPDEVDLSSLPSTSSVIFRKLRKDNEKSNEDRMTEEVFNQSVNDNDINNFNIPSTSKENNSEEAKIDNSLVTSSDDIQFQNNREIIDLTGISQFSSDTFLRKARHMKARCNCTLSKTTHEFKCNEFTEYDRAEICNKFWKKSTWKKKEKFVAGLVHVSPINHQSLASSNQDSQPGDSSDGLIFQLIKEDKRLRVCKKMFLNTFGIGDWSLTNWLKKRNLRLNKKLFS